MGVWQRVEATAADLRPGLTVQVTEGPGHATDIARRAAARGVERLVVVGGDGTIQEAAAGLLGSGTVLGLVPAGTGNDFSRTHRIPRDPAAALAIALGTAGRRVDVGLVNERVYVNVAGVGFDAEVAAWTKYRTSVIRGPALYVVGVLRQLLYYRPTDLTFTIDGREETARCLLLAVGNGRYYGGGMMMCPQAEPDDGLLDVVIGGDVTKLETLGLLPKVFVGKHLLHPKVRSLRAQKVAVSGGSHLTVHADGEPSGKLPADFRCLPGALLIASPAPPLQVE